MVSAFDDLRFSGGKYSLDLKVLTIPICDAIHTNPSAQHVCACEPNVGLRRLRWQSQLKMLPEGMMKG